MSSSRSQKTNQVNFNIPPKFISVNITNTTNGDSYRYPNASDDPWYRLSSSPKSYRWVLNINISPQTHGSNLTRDDFIYNGLDIQKGDWLGYATGEAVKIVEVTSKTSTSATIIVEDYNRYNTFRSATGSGIGNTPAAYIFSVNESGDPVLDAETSVTDTRFYRNIKSAFDYQKSQNNYQLYQLNNTFETGDVVSVTSNGYFKTSSLTSDRMIGIVSDAGPGPGMFSINPNQKLVDFDPDIPGTQGDFVYVSNSGTLTTNIAQSSSKKKAYMIVADRIATRIFGTGADPIIGTATTIAINSVDIAFSSSSDLAQIVSTINTQSSNTNVTAYATGTATETKSTDNSTPFGVPAIRVSNSPSAYFDSGSGNTLVTFTYNEVGVDNGYGDYAASRDITDQINDLGIANLVCVPASDTGGITLTEKNGNSIVITNVVNDDDGNPIAGPTSGTGFNTNTPSSTTQRLVLREDRGWDINIFDNSGVYTNATGAKGGHNGRPVTAMNVEQGVGSSNGSTSSVVASISDRDNLNAQSGDLAYVINKGDGEWGMYLFNGSGWVLTSTQDSAIVDAGVLEGTYDVTLHGPNTLVTLGNISVGRKINGVTVIVNTAFDDTSAETSIGISSQDDLFADGDLSDLSVEGTYFIKPDEVTSDPDNQDVIAVANISIGSSTVGNVSFKVTYL